jgi:CheY-like chemotaxis protein
MDGIEATRLIREYENENNLPPAKIVAVTANAIDGDKERFLQAGMDGYVPKPVNIDKLKKYLER